VYIENMEFTAAGGFQPARGKDGKVVSPAKALAYVGSKPSFDTADTELTARREQAE
jgi:hypothetical protein